ncbi:hypothetical protein AB4Y32_25725 [Paraburkholderia phymatum]|uniref:Uncharacterized protein n=1 Tax=Paraburkholderia phymatum TaxID=148447 RepID=A0ACC6U6Q3_9BURK
MVLLAFHQTPSSMLTSDKVEVCTLATDIPATIARSVVPGLTKPVLWGDVLPREPADLQDYASGEIRT